MIVLDSSFLIAFHNERDAHHAAARSVMGDFLDGRWGQGLLLEYVFLEVVTVLRARRSLATAATVGNVLLAAKELDFVPCSNLFAESWRTFTTLAELGLSFVDCAIIVAAQRQDPSLVATFDSDFRSVPGIAVVP